MNVLILGATSLIARAVAKEYAARGHNVFLAARDAHKAQEIANDLCVRHNIHAQAAHFDAVHLESHEDFIAHVEDQIGLIDVALIAFGDMGSKAHAHDSAGAARHIIDVNYTGAVSLCEAIAHRMCARKSGTIIGISSVAGDRGRQSNYIYGSAKGAFSLYLQGLRNRLHAHHAHVVTAKLGFVNTRMTQGLKTHIPIAEPEDVGFALYRAEQRRTNVLYYPRFWGGIMGIIKAIPETIFKRLKL